MQSRHKASSRDYGNPQESPAIKGEGMAEYQIAEGRRTSKMEVRYLVSQQIQRRAQRLPGMGREQGAFSHSSLGG